MMICICIRIYKILHCLLILLLYRRQGYIGRNPGRVVQQCWLILVITTMMIIITLLDGIVQSSSNPITMLFTTGGGQSIRRQGGQLRLQCR